MDLSTCDREPIHVPGAIQPHGLLLALAEPKLTIVQASANLSDVMGRPVEESIGSPLASALGTEVAARTADALQRGRLEDVNPLPLTVGGSPHDGLIHRHDGLAILELEPRLETGLGARTHHPLRSAIMHLETAETLEELCDAVVRDVRQLTGFDRVMIYEFDAEGHGNVKAEAKAEGLEPYLGLHYPASDVPQQARRLYLSNWLRIIPDARYVPVKLVPTLRDTGAPLDLSFSVLRSVSPIHLEYLANMGVRASMSVSLIVRGRLWGLISCLHHGGPRFLPFGVRFDCELLGRLTSQRLSALADREVAARRAARQGALQTLVAAMRGADRVLPGLLSCPAELLGLLDASGVAILDDEETLTSGAVPSPSAIQAIADALGSRDAGAVFCTSALGVELPELAGARDVASGVMSFPLPGSRRRRILWFRPELVQTVSWGGDPHKPALDTGETRLHPRRSFALWREELRLRSQPWRPADVEAAEDLRRSALEVDLEKQVDRERRAVRARDDLVAVVSHDLKNPLHVIQMQLSVMRGTAPVEVDDRAQRFRASVDRMQRSAERMNLLIHDLLDLAKIEAGRFELRRTEERLTEVLEEAMAILRPLADAKHISLLVAPCSDLTLELDRERIFQVLSNLVGNAIKFTPDGGRIVLSIATDAAQATFAVTDTGPGIPAEHLPHLFNRYWQANTKRSGGSGLGLYIAKGIIEAHGGKIWVELPEAGGAAFKFTLPASARGARI